MSIGKREPDIGPHPTWGWLCRNCGYERDETMGEWHAFDLSCPGCGYHGGDGAYPYGGISPYLPRPFAIGEEEGG